MNSFWADRLDQLPPYLFVEIDRKKREAIAAGRDVIDFGVGDPDLPTHKFIVDAMSEAIRKSDNHRYASGAGSPEYRSTIAAFFARRFGVTLDPNTEVLAMLGSKEGLAHLPTGVLNPGQTALIPDPCYPVYIAGTLFAGGKCHRLALREDNAWLPDLDAIPASALDNARLLFLNYPNNPTAACAPLSFFERAVAFARKHSLLIVQDAAYSEMGFDQPPPSILQVPGAKDVAIELHSLSKTFNMTGWRAAFAVGNAKAIAALAKVKNNVDSGIFGAVQEAAIAAINGIDRPEIKEQIATYRRRRDILVSGLREAGWSVATPQATFYVWASPPHSTSTDNVSPPPNSLLRPLAPAGPKSVATGVVRNRQTEPVENIATNNPTPRGVEEMRDPNTPRSFIDSMTTASRILEEANVVVIPGIGFGQSGEGYVRFALTVTESRTHEAAKRIGKMSWQSSHGRNE